MVKKRPLVRFFFELRGQVDEEWTFADGSFVRAHQHASGARIGEERAIGTSRGGSTTKIHIITDASGNPINFEITGGQVHDSQVAEKLIDHLSDKAECFVADKAYDSDSIRKYANSKGIRPNIPQRSNNKNKDKNFDSYIYKLRHLVENLFARLKHYRSIATRFEKLARNFKSILFLACSLVWMKVGK